MRCLLKRKAVEGYELLEQPVPEPGPQDVLIRVEKVGICDADISLWKWNKAAKKLASLPFMPGHEVTGEVVAVGSHVTSVRKGHKVSVENHFYCGECSLCEDNRGDICPRMSQYGLGRGTDDGGCAQYSLVPEPYCYVITRRLTPVQAVMLEPLGLAYNAVSQVEVGGTKVLVLGAGSVGLLAVAVSKALGASSVYAADTREDRLELAIKMGATEVINASKEDVGLAVSRVTGGEGVERIVEASGAATLLNASAAFIKKYGQIAVVGLVPEPLHIENVTEDLKLKSVTIKTIYGRRIFSTWRACESLLASAKIDVSPLVSHDLPLTSFEEAFQALLSGEACKVLLDPQA